MSRCPIPAIEPRNIDSTAMTAITCVHSPGTPPKAPHISRAIIAMAATLGAVAKKAVTGVGEPS